MQEARIALLVDFENLFVSVQDQFREFVQWKRILRAAEQQGRVIVRRVYADWSRYPTPQKELLSLGFELVHVAGHSKNAADIPLTIDAMQLATRKEFPLSHVFLVSGDGDFTDLAHSLRNQGLNVVGIGVRATSAASFVAACDRFLYYDDLIAEGHRSPVAAALLSTIVNSPKVESYLKALSPKVRMSVNPLRPWIIVRAYHLIQQNQGAPLNVLKEKLPAYYQEHHPSVPQSLVQEVFHQLFHTFCFEFDPPGKEEGPPLWDRPAYLVKSIRSATELLEHCDRGLLRILQQNLAGERIDPPTATFLLYGRNDEPRLIEHVQRLIETLS